MDISPMNANSLERQGTIVEQRAEAAAEDARAEAERYDYGYEAAPGGAGNFISDGELMLWLQAKSEGEYGELRTLMDISTERGQLMQDLTHLKSIVDANAPSATIIDECNRLREAYAGTEYASELERILPSALGTTAAFAEVAGASIDIAGEDGVSATLSQDLQGMVDALGRDDQLELVRIQELMSNIREGSQLTSNILSSRDQAGNTIVSNIRG